MVRLQQFTKYPWATEMPKIIKESGKKIANEVVIDNKLAKSDQGKKEVEAELSKESFASKLPTNDFVNSMNAVVNADGLFT